MSPAAQALFDQCESVCPGWVPDPRYIHTKVNGHIIMVIVPLFKGDHLTQVNITPRWAENGPVWTRDVFKSGFVADPHGPPRQCDHALDAFLSVIKEGIAWVSTQENPEHDEHCLNAGFWSDE